ncbi:aromatase/cyclase [Streptomyces silvensis]|uniref:Cyclase n=1 Tax=Streptomyces silvensis TaxID=1765722 RepID=A0A0W7X813_9ACTN|nr:SRPBCC family protein [Streptomyces silvensis]KUF19100.1 cyclase [Streptomyces silvensis]
MSGERVHRVSHAVEVAAPAGVVYGLIADAVQWPLYFPANVHVERLDYDGVRERLRMWVVADGQVKSWTSSRVQDPARRTVTYRQEQLMEPAASMGGTWSVTELGAERCRLAIDHAFSATGDRPEDLAWLERATRANARADLSSLQDIARRWSRLDQLVLSFEERLRVHGPAELLYGFLYEAADWSQQVPYVTGVDLDETQAGIQKITMGVRGEDGGEEQVTSVRVCFPHAGRIVFKEPDPRGPVAAHCGEWLIDPDESGVTVIAQHHVVLCEDTLARTAPGTDAATALNRARRQVRARLARESGTLMELAREHAETAVRHLTPAR